MIKLDFLSASILGRTSRLACALALPALTGLLATSGACSSDNSAPDPALGQGGGAGAAVTGQSGAGSSGTASVGTAGAATAAGGASAGDSATGGALSSGGSLGNAGSAGTGDAGNAAAGSGGSSASAGSAGVAGSAGSAGTAGTTGGASSGCAGKAYKLCEDFESGTSGGIPTSWTKYKGYGAGAAQDITLATDQFHSGKMAVKSNSGVKGQQRIEKSLSALGATASKHWGRIFYKVQSPATKPTSGVLHGTFVGLLGSTENRVVDIVENTGGSHQWLYNNPDDKGSVGSAYNWKFDDAWHCAEWYVDVGAKSFRFFSDSQEVPAIGFTGKADAEMSNYTGVIVGSTFYQEPPAPFVMWFDDLAINDTQIGCQ